MYRTTFIELRRYRTFLQFLHHFLLQQLLQSLYVRIIDDSSNRTFRIVDVRTMNGSFSTGIKVSKYFITITFAKK